MERFDIKFSALALCLSFMAGNVDALGFLQLGGYFVSFMSGNSTRLSVALTDFDWRHAAVIGSIIGLFVLGALSGTLARHSFANARKMEGVFCLLTLLLTLAALSHTFGHSGYAIGFMTLAMGFVNTVFEREGDVAIGLTYMTGALVKIGQRAANALLGKQRYAWLPYLLLWISLITGGASGVVLFHHFGLYSIWLAALWAALLAAMVTWGFNRPA